MIRPLILFAALIAAPALAAPETTTPAPAKADRQKVICRRFPVTGSLAQTHRECRTRTDWDRAREEAVRTCDRMTIHTGQPNGS